MARSIGTGTEDLLAHIDGHLGVITFNRPERRNALSDPMYAGFDRALPVMADDPDVRVLVAALRLMKQNLSRALVADLATALDAEAPNMVESMSTADHREAAAAFVEKRRPVFAGS